MRGATVILACLGLAGATASAAETRGEVAGVDTVLALDADGLRAVEAESGRASLLPFGHGEAATLEAIGRIDGGGPAEAGHNEECPAGPMNFARFDSVTVWFQEGAFVGWAAEPHGATTMAGLGIFSPRSELDAAYALDIAETSLGDEFEIGGIYGVLSSGAPDGEVTALWAGTVCIFR